MKEDQTFQHAMNLVWSEFMDLWMWVYFCSFTSIISFHQWLFVLFMHCCIYFHVKPWLPISVVIECHATRKKIDSNGEIMFLPIICLRYTKLVWCHLCINIKNLYLFDSGSVTYLTLRRKWRLTLCWNTLYITCFTNRKLQHLYTKRNKNRIYVM